MRRFFLGFFLILVVLFFDKSFVLAVDLLEQLNPDRAPEKIGGVAKDVLKGVAVGAVKSIPVVGKVAEETAGAVKKSPEEKAADSAKTDAEKILKLYESKKNCGKINTKCCSKEDLKEYTNKQEFRTDQGLFSVVIDSFAQPLLVQAKDELLKEIDAMDQNELDAIACEKGYYPVYTIENDPKSCMCKKERGFPLQKLCDALDNPKEKTSCQKNTNSSVWTALGPISFILGDFIQTTLLGWGIGLAGVVSLFCIIYSAFMMQISGANPEKLKKTKDMLTACIIGFLLIICSVFILKIIGVNILRIPGFS